MHRLTYIAAATLCLAAAACGSSEAPIGPDPTGTTSGGEGGAPSDSGSRLRARRLVADDGATQFAGWRDTERDEDCTFRKAADGKTRCLPEATSVIPAGFTDAACTVPIIDSGVSCSGEGATVLVASDSCDGGAQVWKVGAAFTGTPGETVYYRRSGAECGERFYNGEAFSMLSSQVDASSFVAAKVQVD